MEENSEEVKNENSNVEIQQITTVQELNDVLVRLSFHLSESGRLMLYLPDFRFRGKKMLELSDFILNLVEQNQVPEKITEEKTDSVLDEILNVKL